VCAGACVHVRVHVVHLRDASAGSCVCGAGGGQFIQMGFRLYSSDWQWVTMHDHNE